MSAPLLSIVVVVYDMKEQAKRTLLSLSTEYQRGVSSDDYEVIVVENSSARMLGEEAALSHAMNCRYFARDETLKTPVPAINFGAERAQAPHVALMIDGARMVSPGVIRTALDALRAAPNAVVSVPGYHLGSELQQLAVTSGYDTQVEAELLAGIGWPSDGYRLFDISCLSGSCRGGLLAPYAESNFLCLSRQAFDELGGYDPRFVSLGGGFCNLDLYKRACERPSVTVFTTPAEGTFHQFHGGATTGGTSGAARDRVMKEALTQYEQVRGETFVIPRYEPFLFGPIPANVRRFLLP